VFIFFFGDDKKEQFLKKSESKMKEGDAGILGAANGNMVWLADDAQLHHLVHEIHHAKWIFTDVLGIKCEETEAYIVSRLFQMAHKRFARWKEELAKYNVEQMRVKNEAK
jgi:uncharacterized protein with NRDE domain